jgi:Phosphoribosylaminoimidazolesuccinocarboxamide (SAICAR) synthase
MISKKRFSNNFARKQANTKGIIIANTKFEFGLEGDNRNVIEEMLTPDSSRFWVAKFYKPDNRNPVMTTNRGRID